MPEQSFARGKGCPVVGFVVASQPDGAALALHSGLLDLQVAKGLRLDRKLVRKAVALRPPLLVVRGAYNFANTPPVCKLVLVAGEGADDTKSLFGC
jgi:hypothetical protein